MKKKLIDRRSYKEGETCFYIDDKTGSIVTGVITTVTTKFCMIDIGDGKPRRKTKRYVFNSLDSLKLSLIREVNYVLKDMHGMQLSDITKIFREMMEEYPEKFV